MEINNSIDNGGITSPSFSSSTSPAGHDKLKSDKEAPNPATPPKRESNKRGNYKQESPTSHNSKRQHISSKFIGKLPRARSFLERASTYSQIEKKILL